MRGPGGGRGLSWGGRGRGGPSGQGSRCVKGLGEGQEDRWVSRGEGTVRCPFRLPTLL